MAIQEDNRSIPGLLTGLVDQVTTLLRKEAQLAKSEMSDKLTQVSAAAGALAVAAALLIAGLVLLLQAAAVWLTRFDLSPVTAMALVGAVVVIIGMLMLMKGISSLKPANLAPKRSMEQMQRNVDTVREQIR
jgi:drug/metabolite transporter (DMT)-like permease